MRFVTTDWTRFAFGVRGCSLKTRPSAALTLGIGTMRPMAKLMTKLMAKLARNPMTMGAMGISGGRSAVRFPTSERAKLIRMAMMSETLKPIFFTSCCIL